MGSAAFSYLYEDGTIRGRERYEKAAEIQRRDRYENGTMKAKTERERYEDGTKMVRRRYEDGTKTVRRWNEKKGLKNRLFVAISFAKKIYQIKEVLSLI